MVKRYGVKTEENEVQHMKFGYIRVSTRKQARDGNSLEAQREALTAAGAEKIYTDAFTGTRMERIKKLLRKKIEPMNRSPTVTAMSAIIRTCRSALRRLVT